MKMPNEKEITETLMLLKAIKGQRLIGILPSPDYKEWTLHFEDFVIEIKDMPFPSPIIEREIWKNAKT